MARLLPPNEEPPVDPPQVNEDEDDEDSEPDYDDIIDDEWDERSAWAGEE